MPDKFDDNPNATNKLFNQSGTKFFFKSNIVAKIENKIVTIIWIKNMLLKFMNID